MADDNKGDTMHENAIGWGILLVIFAVIIWLIWHNFDDEIRNAVRWLRWGEMWLLSWFIGDQHTVTFNGQETGWWQGFTDTPKWQAHQLTNAHLSYFSALAMQPLRFVFVPLLVGAGIWCLLKGPDTHYRDTLGLEGLIKRQAPNFPVISPFVNFDPSKQPPRPPGSPVPAELPPFAEALGPEEWLAYNSVPVPDGKIDEHAAFEAFGKQLGGRWKGVKALKPYQQVLAAAFCLKASRKRNESDELLGRLATCWHPKKGLKLSMDRSLLKEARKILRNRDLAAHTVAQMNRHAYVTTALLRGLMTAREEGGVLAPSQFLWLRAYDRALWYPLNNLGRQSFHMEAMGAMSHFKQEKRTQRPIPVPKLEDAVSGIVDYMSSKRARPIPSLDYSASKKRGVKKAKA